MHVLKTILFLALFAWPIAPIAAHAETSVQVLETDPSGNDITLARNQNFYLRLGYATDHPIRIWAEPYFHGRQANAGSNPSGTHTGTGEALGWFFFAKPGEQVDEIRIRAGDGSTSGTHVVAAYPVRITGGAQTDDAHVEPDWVVAMKRQAAVQQRAAYEKSMGTPPTVGETAFFGGFMLLMLAVGFLGFAGPAWGLWRWRGGWRIAAAAPAALMGFVVLRLVVDTAADPTSHNLWPFEILQMGTVSIVAMAVLLLVRKSQGLGI